MNATFTPSIRVNSLNPRANHKPAAPLSFLSPLLRAVQSLITRQDDPAALRYVANKYNGLGD